MHWSLGARFRYIWLMPCFSVCRDFQGCEFAFRSIGVDSNYKKSSVSLKTVYRTALQYKPEWSVIRKGKKKGWVRVSWGFPARKLNIDVFQVAMLSS